MKNLDKARAGRLGAIAKNKKYPRQKTKTIRVYLTAAAILKQKAQAMNQDAIALASKAITDIR